MLLGVTESYLEPDPAEGEVSWNWSGDSLDSLSLSLQQGRLENPRNQDACQGPCQLHGEQGGGQVQGQGHGGGQDQQGRVESSTM